MASAESGKVNVWHWWPGCLRGVVRGRNEQSGPVRTQKQWRPRSLPGSDTGGGSRFHLRSIHPWFGIRNRCFSSFLPVKPRVCLELRIVMLQKENRQTCGWFIQKNNTWQTRASRCYPLLNSYACCHILTSAYVILYRSLHSVILLYENCHFITSAVKMWQLLTGLSGKVEGVGVKVHAESIKNKQKQHRETCKHTSKAELAGVDGDPVFTWSTCQQQAFISISVLFYFFFINHLIFAFFFFFNKICALLIKSCPCSVASQIVRMRKKADFAFMSCCRVCGWRGRYKEQSSDGLIKERKCSQSWSQNIYFTSHETEIKGWGKEFMFKTEADKVSSTGWRWKWRNSHNKHSHTHIYISIFLRTLINSPGFYPSYS